MKKTLVALAVLAASGASFAQVTLTGNVTMGYRAATTGGATASDTSGLGIDTTALTFTAVEDLGAGMSAKAMMSFDGLNRAAVGGGDASLAVGGGFGTVTMSTGRGSDYLSGGVSGVGGVGMDDKVFSRLDASDAISYASPVFAGGLRASIAHSEDAVSRANETNGQTIGLGVGAAGTPTTASYQRGTTVGVSYSAGAIAANANYKMYDQYEGVNNNAKTRLSLAGAYNFGVAKVGAGYRTTNFTLGTRQDTFLAVGVPMGALTLGADIGSRKQDDRATATDNGTRTGYGVKADYALSKRTSLIVSHASWESAVNVANRSTETNFLVSHSF